MSQLQEIMSQLTFFTREAETGFHNNQLSVRIKTNFFTLNEHKQTHTPSISSQIPLSAHITLIYKNTDATNEAIEGPHWQVNHSSRIRGGIV